MDPTATLDLILDALLDDDDDGALIHLEDLAGWLHSGGFAPELSDMERETLRQLLWSAPTGQPFDSVRHWVNGLTPLNGWIRENRSTIDEFARHAGIPTPADDEAREEIVLSVESLYLLAQSEGVDV